MSVRGLLLDLDDTLYDYAPAEAAARPAVLADVARTTGRSDDEVAEVWSAARKAVKARLGNTASAHSRLLYLAELAARLGAGLPEVRGWDRTYWATFLDTARLRPGALELLDGWRGLGHRTAICTDLTLEVQLWKLERFGLFDRIDALVASEEVPKEKPELDLYHLALTRLGLDAEACVIVGDNPKKDGGAAERLGVPYLRARSSETGEGDDLFTIAASLGLPRADVQRGPDLPDPEGGR